LLFSLGIKAQTWKNLRTKTIAVSDSVLLDTLSIVPGSLMIRDLYGNFFPDTCYHIDAPKSMAYFNKRCLSVDTVQIVYRVFPINFSASYPKNKQYQNNPVQPPVDFLFQEIKHDEDEPKSLIQANGIIARGIGVGNNQNLTMNSSMNLQLSGQLDNEIKIEAYLSDKNLPLQADGYSQQVQAFDQIYIKVYDSLRMLQMGDLTLNSTEGYFLKFNRKLQGAKAEAVFPMLKTKMTDKVQLGAAISKGTYNRQTFNAKEGVQGPYQLNGANNETYIVVLAGTEKVYLDGDLLQRGENAGYVIDYNTAEITFTPKNLLTSNSRIIVEFEYSDRNYNRYNLFVKDQMKSEKGIYTVAFYSESDARNQPVDQEMTDEKRRILANAGDDATKAVVPYFDSVEYNINLILYKMVDTTVNSVVYDSVFVQSYHSDSAFYQVGFAFVGENTGNYILTTSSANGKVYRWIAPENGIRQGNYQPVKALVAPYKKQMLTARAQYQISKKTAIDIETAFSNCDKNTFSSIDNKDNEGIAGHAKISQLIEFNNFKTKIELDGQMVSKDFKAIERFREAEFEREWNLLAIPYGNEYSGGIGLSFIKKDKTLLATQSQYLGIANDYTGFRNALATQFSVKKLVVDAKASLLNSSNQGSDSRFYKHSVNICQPVKGWKLGIMQDMEDNRVKAVQSDSLLAASEKFYKTTCYLKITDTTTNQLGLSYGLRSDYLPANSGFRNTTQSHDVSFNSTINSGDASRLNAILTWRTIEVEPYGKLQGIRSDNLLTTQINHQWKIKKGVLSITSFYENSTAMENRKEFVYVEVAVGKGIYIWNDYNQDGVPQLDEFEISAYSEEANYIRVYTPSSDYMKIYQAKWSETIRFNPAVLWKGKKGIKGVLARFSDDLSYRNIIKHTNNDFISKISPLKNGLADSTLQNWSQNLRNAFSFNRNNPVFTLDWIYVQNGQKVLLANGFDQNLMKTNQIKMRWNISPKWMITNDIILGKKEFRSEYFIAKNHQVKSLENQIALQWQPSVKLRFSADYNPCKKKNLWGLESSFLHQIGADIKYSMPKQGVFSIRFEFISIDYNGAANNSVSYEMLDGNGPGKNYRVTLHYQQTIGEYLQLSIDYFGRKPAVVPMIHTGQVSLSAVF
jgi:hypothetical protein